MCRNMYVMVLHHLDLELTDSMDLKRSEDMQVR